MSVASKVERAVLVSCFAMFSCLAVLPIIFNRLRNSVVFIFVERFALQ